MANCELPFFLKGIYLWGRRGEEAEMQRPEFLSEQTHVEENTLLWLDQKNPQHCPDISNPLHVYQFANSTNKQPFMRELPRGHCEHFQRAGPQIFFSSCHCEFACGSVWHHARSPTAELMLQAFSQDRGGGGSLPAPGRLSPRIYTHTHHVIIVKICKNSRKQRKFVCWP